MINAYPLHWPEGWKRTAANLRKRAHFNKKERQYSTAIPSQPQQSWQRTKGLSISDGIDRVLGELARMGVERQDVIISSNVRTRLDGLPRSGERDPQDPGVAVYWQRRKEPMRSMAIDRYDRVADNLAALGATLEAMRAIERHGGAEILERAFTGFAALPERATQSWRHTLGFEENETVTAAEVQSAFRALSHKHHPDKAGSRENWDNLCLARENALKDLQP